MSNKLTHKRAGVATIVGPGIHKEFETATCNHCNTAWCTRSTEKGKGDPGGFCRLCMKMICPKCVGKECVPFEKRLAIYEQSQDLFRKMGMTL